MKMRDNRRRIERLDRIRKNSAVLGTSAILLVAIPTISSANVGSSSRDNGFERRVAKLIAATEMLDADGVSPEKNSWRLPTRFMLAGGRGGRADQGAGGFNKNWDKWLNWDKWPNHKWNNH